MSELRDLTVALRAFHTRMSSVEDCLLVLVRDSQQQSEWRHTQKNQSMVDTGLREEQETAMKQVQEACGAVSHKLFEFSDRLDNYAKTRLDDVKGLNARIGAVEAKLEVEEVTQT